MNFFKKNSLFIFIIVSLAVASLWGLWEQAGTGVVEKLPAVSDCKLQLQTCETQVQGLGKVVVDISPKNAKATDPLQLTAQFARSEIKQVMLEFKGKTMQMGYLKYPLHPQSSRGLFIGKGGLSVCTSEVMQWWVVLHFVYNNIHYQLPFEMETFYNPASTSK